MVKLLAIVACSLLIAGSVVIIDRQSLEFAPPALAVRRVAALPERICATGLVEGRTEDIELRPETAGRVVDVVAEMGQWVNAGDVLVRLDSRVQEQQVAASLANLKLAQANVDRLVNGARDVERQEARSLVAAKKARLRQAMLTWQRVKTLRAQDAIAQQEADDQEGLVHALNAEAQAAEARLAQLEAAAREDELRAAQARVAMAEADYEQALIALDKTSLRAPVRAQVLDVAIEPGEMIESNRIDPVVVLVDTSHLRIRAFVEEIDAPRVVPGLIAKITADGLPNQDYQATVCTLSPRMERKSHATDEPDELYDTKIREVLLDVDPSTAASGLIVGLRVDVTMDLQCSPSTTDVEATHLISDLPAKPPGTSVE
jgi:HlyD family secretion protein